MIEYNKITYVDGVTPLNAANLNKIERAVSNLSQNSLFPSELLEGEGITLDKNKKTGTVKVSTKNCLFSSTIRRFEVLKSFDPDTAEFDCLYIILNSNYKLSGIYLGGILIYEPGGE